MSRIDLHAMTADNRENVKRPAQVRSSLPSVNRTIATLTAVVALTLAACGSGTSDHNYNRPDHYDGYSRMV